MQKKIPTYVVDAFTDVKFKGNPAAVCLLDEELPDEIMQKIAFEMNLSETAFIRSFKKKSLSDSQRFSLRWFTPKVEVPLCGHATLATAWVLFHDIKIKTQEISFETLSGTLIAKKEDEGVLLNFPSSKPKPYDPPKVLLSCLGISQYEACQLARESKKILIHLKDEDEVLKVEPDFERMNEISLKELIGVIITSAGSPPFDFVSRFFAPWVGVPEDPVTGSAHTVLTPYWSNILNKKEMLAYQASQRGGELLVRQKDERVELIGKATIISKGELFL